MNICVLSACYEKPEFAAILTESCRLNNVDLGFCQAAELNGVWPASGDMRVGKMVAALEHLKLIQETQAYTHALWSDGFDTFLQGGEGEIVGGWELLGCPSLVLSAEKNCWPHPEYEMLYPKVKGPYRFINAGTWFGQVGYLIDVIERMIEASEIIQEINDQPIWINSFLTGQLPGAVIDSERRIFQTMWGYEDADGPIEAPVVHYNGGIWRNPEDRRYITHWQKVKEAKGWT